MKRLAHTQVWPLLRYFEAIAPSTAATRSASSNTRNGALPPSSMETRFIVLAACSTSFLPVSVEPVKVILRTVGLEVSSAPISLALPVTMLTTPGGMPAFSASAPQASPENGVCEAGLITIVQPVASAGPSLRAIIEDGKFHGVIAATTPTGCLMVRMRRPCQGEGIVSP